MLKIRLARIGKKKKPTYRIIVSEAGRDTFGKFLEILGYYNPFTKVCEVKKDQILYWLEKGAKLSPTIHNLLVDQNVIGEKKVKAYRSSKKKKPAATETLAGKEEKKERPIEGEKAEKKEVKTGGKPEEKPKEEKKNESEKLIDKKESEKQE